VVRYEEPGRYEVSLTAANVSGSRTLSRQEVVVIRERPAAELTSSQSQVCLGEEVVLSAAGEGPFQWFLGEVTPEPSSNQVRLQPEGDATYRIETRPNAYGCVGQAEVSVRVGQQGRSLQVSPPRTVVCLGEEVKLEATGAQSYRWRPARTLSSDRGGLVYARPTETTIYTVMGLSPGCTTRQEITVEVQAPPRDFQVRSDRTLLCPGEEARLEAYGAASFSWSPATGLSRSEGAQVVARPTRSTTYQVTAQDVNGCTATKEIEVRTETRPDVIIRASQTLLCPGEEVLLNANGANQFAWLPASGLTPSGAEARVVPESTTQYAVVGRNSAGCVDTATIDIQVRDIEQIGRASCRERV